jgi:hypothetical protein
VDAKYGGVWDGWCSLGLIEWGFGRILGSGW